MFRYVTCMNFQFLFFTIVFSVFVAFLFIIILDGDATKIHIFILMNS